MADNHTDKVFKAVADPTRRRIFHLLVFAGAAMSLTDITDNFDMSRQGITKHVKYLQRAGLVNIKTDGRERFCEANPTPLHEIKNWLAVYDRFWDEQLKNLEDFLDDK